MRVWVTPALLTLLVVAISMPHVAAETTTITNVSYVRSALFDVDTRTSIPPLTVNATLGFSDAKAGEYLAAGIFDLDDGNLVVGMGSSTPDSCLTASRYAGCIIALANNAGSESMQFSLDYPKSTWNLVLEAALLDNNTHPVANSFSDYTFTLNVQTGLTLLVKVPSNVSINIDGVIGSPGTVQLVLPTGHHTLSAPEFVAIDNVTRLKFLDWSDGSTAANRSIDLNHDITLTGDYVTQYHLAIVSPVSVNGTGWYDAGTVTKLSIGSPTEPMGGILGLLGGRWVFQGWYVDDMMNSSSPQTSVAMLSGLVITARWAPDYSVPLLVLALVILVSSGVFYATRRKTRKTRSRRRRPRRSRRRPSKRR